MSAHELVVVLLTMASAHTSVAAQRAEFNLIETFRCDFTESEGRRTSADGVMTAANREVFDDLVVDSVDYARANAQFIGNIGSETVELIDGDRIVSFLERTSTGNINVLSIVKKAESVGVYPAVYSRHTAFLTGDVTLSQSYGTCRGLM